jgi:ABC-type glycerol-3-phosphate transport system substrate-binding protein
MTVQRRSLSLALGATAIAATLGLCCAAQAQQKEVRWGQWKGTEVGEKFMSELKAAFEKDNPDIKLVTVDSPFTGFHDRAIVLHQAKKLPDVLLIRSTGGGVRDLGMIDPRLTSELPRSQRIFANIPATFHQQWRQAALSANRKRRRRAVLQYRSVQGSRPVRCAKTWDEFAEYARKLTNPDKRQFATTATLASEPPTNMTYDIYPLILQAGGTLIDEKTNRAVFNSPAGVKAIEWYVDLVNKDKVVVPGVLSNGEKEKRANFASGNIAMMFEGPWGIAIQKQLNPNLNYDIATLPAGNAANSARLPQRSSPVRHRTRMQPGPSCAGCQGRRVSRCGQGNWRLPGADRCVESGLVQGAQAVSAFVTQMSSTTRSHPSW